MKIAFFTVAGGADAGWFSHVNWPVLALAVVIWGVYIKFRWHPIIYIALPQLQELFSASDRDPRV